MHNRDLIGVRAPFFLQDSVFSTPNMLKRELLVWDKMAIVHLESWLPTIHRLSKDEQYQGARDFLWLYENGYVLDLDLDRAACNNPEIKTLVDALAEYFRCLRNDPKMSKPVSTSKAWTAIYEDTLARIGSYIVPDSMNQAGVPLLRNTKSFIKLPNTVPQNVALIALDKMPVPHDDISYEKLFDYKNDPESKDRIRELRLWFSKTSRENRSAEEISDEIDTLLSQYEKHLRIHRMKYSNAQWETLVTCLPEVVENLVRLKFSKIVKPYFRLKKHKVDLMECELTAPGHELAYIQRSREYFQ